MITGDIFIDMILITLLPFLELRASIPYGILTLGVEKWWIVFLVCVVVNIILGLIIYFFIEFIMKILIKIPFFGKFWHRHVEKTQKKIHKYVEKYGEWAVAVFIGIPLPGSGVYSGAIASYLIDLDFKSTKGTFKYLEALW